MHKAQHARNLQAVFVALLYNPIIIQSHMAQMHIGTFQLVALGNGFTVTTTVIDGFILEPGTYKLIKLNIVWEIVGMFNMIRKYD